ncbi:GGDEF domain-containing protein [Microseira sp. BLCC-F43]|uniref:GGDEF domain-containing protein n=1 Tax=Microseira sp. BLCC-F43 TaxID=3153602 RepID=UPI0035B7DFEA
MPVRKTPPPRPGWGICCICNHNGDLTKHDIMGSLGFKAIESQPSLLDAHVSDIIHPHLGLHSTLEELFLYDFHLELSQPGRKVTQAFEANPMLPGVILTKRGKFAGMISRRRFLEYMSRPFGLEVFSKRPVEDLYQFAKTDLLILPGNTSILAAAQRLLQRSYAMEAVVVMGERSRAPQGMDYNLEARGKVTTPDLLYEPIVVEISPQVYRLLDVHQLLVAQSRIHQMALELIEQLNQKLATANQELQLLAAVDSLTKVANRRKFDEYLHIKWREMAREKAPLSLILCDIDFFKRYNDTYGHQAGDVCLQQVASALSRAAKRPEDLVARYGGEEFAAILPHTDSAGAIHVAEKMRVGVLALEIPHADSAVNQYVTISVGVASAIPHLESSPEELIAAADQALYHAKESGRDRYTFYPTEIA